MAGREPANRAGPPESLDTFLITFVVSTGTARLASLSEHAEKISRIPLTEASTETRFRDPAAGTPRPLGP